jgi:hypothetical protein
VFIQGLTAFALTAVLLLLLAPVTVCNTLASSRQRNTPIKAITSASLAARRA